MNKLLWLIVVGGCAGDAGELYTQEATGVAREHIVSLYAYCQPGDRALGGECSGGMVVRARTEQPGDGWQYCVFDGPAGANVTAKVFCEKSDEHP